MGREGGGRGREGEEGRGNFFYEASITMLPKSDKKVPKRKIIQVSVSHGQAQIRKTTH